jgi:hypothetical protein
MDRNHAFAIPVEVLHPLLKDLNTTQNEDGSNYWHIQLTEAPSGDVSLLVPKRKANFRLADYILKL